MSLFTFLTAVVMRRLLCVIAATTAGPRHSVLSEVT